MDGSHNVKNKINSKGEYMGAMKHMRAMKHIKDTFDKLVNGDYDSIYDKGYHTATRHHYEIFYEFSVDILKVLIDTYLQVKDNYRRMLHFKWILENNAFLLVR